MMTGSDGHCCRGVSLPALNDADAVWSFYEGLLSPSPQAILVDGSTSTEGGAASAVEELALHRAQLAERDAMLAERDTRLAEKDAEIAALKAQLQPPTPTDPSW